MYFLFYTRCFNITAVNIQYCEYEKINKSRVEKSLMYNCTYNFEPVRRNIIPAAKRVELNNNALHVN